MTRREYTSTRVFDAPRELVWQAWTDPEQLARWWGPKGVTTPPETIQLDPRPGGAFRLTMVSEATGAEFPTDMRFREVVEPERIVFGWEAQRGVGAGEVTITFKDLGDRTEMTTHFVGYQTDEIARESQAGWRTQLDKLAEHLAAGTKQRRRRDVGAIHVHEFMSLDGVIDAPTWTFEYGFEDRMGEVLGAVTGRSRGILLGRNTYEMFEQSWSTRTVEEDPGAPFFNDTTKYVVSGTLTDPTWRNSKVAGPYDPDAIRRLKDEVDGDLYTSGSITLVRAMLADGLVDELHLFVYPLTRGPGPRLFPEDAPPSKLALAACESYDNGVVYLGLRPQA